MSRVIARSVDASIATSARDLEHVVEVVMSSSVSPMDGREREESSAFGRGSKEAIDVVVSIERRDCANGGGHSSREGSGGRCFF